MRRKQRVVRLRDGRAREKRDADIVIYSHGSVPRVARASRFLQRQASAGLINLRDNARAMARARTNIKKLKAEVKVSLSGAILAADLIEDWVQLHLGPVVSNLMVTNAGVVVDFIACEAKSSTARDGTFIDDRQIIPPLRYVYNLNDDRPVIYGIGSDGPRDDIPAHPHVSIGQGGACMGAWGPSSPSRYDKLDLIEQFKLAVVAIRGWRRQWLEEDCYTHRGEMMTHTMNLFKTNPELFSPIEDITGVVHADFAMLIRNGPRSIGLYTVVTPCARCRQPKLDCVCCGCCGHLRDEKLSKERGVVPCKCKWCPGCKEEMSICCCPTCRACDDDTAKIPDSDWRCTKCRRKACKVCLRPISGLSTLKDNIPCRCLYCIYCKKTSDWCTCAKCSRGRHYLDRNNKCSPCYMNYGLHPLFAYVRHIKRRNRTEMQRWGKSFSTITYLLNDIMARMMHHHTKPTDLHPYGTVTSTPALNCTNGRGGARCKQCRIATNIRNVLRGQQSIGWSGRSLNASVYR